MDSHKQLIDVAVGRILNKYDVTPSKDLSVSEKNKVKQTVLSIQQEVEQFLARQKEAADASGKPSLDLTGLDLLGSAPKITLEPEEEEVVEVVEVEEPVVNRVNPVASVKKAQTNRIQTFKRPKR
ncbi:hypothetical protein [Alkalicoccobacillus murimartini]|uniref:Spore coat protein n=1 Tax=Alkalicoccobacillus murimartini TaxID=171685 RepID=A0ABT9YJZ3_9BACI|nr:hypothetical protein [Alkalicoccobacillus murimartini]MDQ0208188.1 hypothetical protein [Alkalicoccobacillus murimartini]